jgi:two-component system, NtrC family, response regulator AtoC
MSELMPTVLVAEDEEEVREFLEMALRCDGYAVESAVNGEEVLETLSERGNTVSAVLMDILMPRKDGLTALREMRERRFSMPVYVISAATSPFDVVEAMRAGATDFLAKPLSHEDVRKVLPPVPKQPAVERLKRDGAPRSPTVFFGNSPRMRMVLSFLQQVGFSEAPVLIQGETGSGKEVIARELHALSPRAVQPFLKLNCAALPSELVESELFGYERGAFTGAFERKAGMFELADGGTLLLDEIGDMDYRLQAKLLQVLQDRTFRRLGGKDLISVDVRVLAATHRNLEVAAQQGGFRLDLYYRLNVINIELPPLRERKEDILGLAEFFLEKYRMPNTPSCSLPPGLKQAMIAYPWPGNIRELENTMRRFLILRDSEVLEADLSYKSGRHRPVLVMASASPRPRLADPVEEEPVLAQVAKAKQAAESEAIVQALNATRWNRKRAAEMLNIDYKALLYKMKKLEIGD